jgi:phosphoribosyl 1,2-cyclic phosphodiesterase
MRFCSIGSGSSGNALVVNAGQTHVMLDCGLAVTHAVHRLAAKGVDPKQINAIVVTHEHGDHIGGVARFANKFNTPVYATRGTAFALNGIRPELVNLMDPHASFAVGDIEVSPFLVPHDAREPTQAVFSDGNVRLGVVTDLGSVTQHVVNSLHSLTALVLECNHDERMLNMSSYPQSLKRRILGSWGHLSNTQAALLLENIDRSKLRHLIAAHLSEENNKPELAQGALAKVMNCAPTDIEAACQEDGFGWRDV